MPLVEKYGTRGLSLVRDWRKRLDNLCREVIMLRDDRCQWCGKFGPLDWAHINSRRFPSTRWSLSNSLALCKGCHLRWHHRPLEGAAWFEAQFPERALALRVVRGVKVDPHGTFILLTQEKRRYEQEADRMIGGGE